MAEADHGDTVLAGKDGLMPTTDGLDNLRAAIDLTAGAHSLSVSVEGDTSNEPEQIRLAWMTPVQRKVDHETAIAAAKSANTAVVFVWTRGRPDFGLPGEQDKLIEEVAAVNANTIVVLNVSQPIAMGEPGGHLTESGKVFGARHLGAMQAFDFFPAFTELDDHLVEVASQVANFVVAVGEANRCTQVPAADLGDLLLKFNHRTLDGVGEDDEQCAADRNCSCASNKQDKVTLGIAPGNRREQEQQHPAEQNAGNRNERFD